MSAYEEIRNRLTKNDKNGFPMWKKVLAGMMAGGREEEEKEWKMLTPWPRRYWATDGVSHGPDKDSDTDGGEEATAGETSPSSG